MLLVIAAMAAQGARANWRFPRTATAVGATSSNENDAELSAILKRDLPPGSTILCNKPWVPMYAGLEWRASPHVGAERMVTYALAKKVDFAVLGLWQMSKLQPGMALYPYLARKITIGNREVVYLFDFRHGPFNDKPLPKE